MGAMRVGLVGAICLSLGPAATDFDAGLAVYVDGNYASALREWRPLAEQGNARAQYWLGYMHENGIGVLRDNAVAARWYRNAADQGLVGAQVYLGTMHVTGRGVPQSLIEAYKWYSLAAATGDKVAENNQDVIAASMTPEQITEAQRLAHLWREAFALRSR